MARLMEHVEYLSKEIGPRPGGTEEEQQAALYITEQFQKESGFKANIEEFESSSGLDLAKTILAAITIVVVLLAVFLPVLAIPAFIVTALAAGAYTMETFERPLVSRFLGRGASQNVVAKYQPSFEDEASRRGRSRKFILVAHYDTGRVTPPVIERIDSLGLPMSLVCVVAMIAVAFLQLLRIFIAPGGGMGLLILNFLSIVGLVVCALPIVRTVLMRRAPYNEGANNNASGTVALLEVARRISHGSVSEADLANLAEDAIAIHGEQAAREAGLIPEGVQLVYEAESPELADEPGEMSEQDEEQRLLSAKAAIAALTGQPVEQLVYSAPAAEEPAPAPRDDGEEGAQPDFADVDYVAQDEHRHDYVQPVAPDAAAPVVRAYEPQPVETNGFQNAPSWFVVAQQNAKRAPEGAEQAPVQRSRYNEAFDNAERERAQREAELRAAEEAQRERERLIRERELRAQMARQEAEERRAREAAEAQAAAEAAAAAEAQAAAEAERRAREAAAAEARAKAAPLPEIEEHAPAGRSIDLPSVSGAQDESAVAGSQLAQDLPSIDGSEAAGVPETTSPSRSGLLRSLRNNVPSLSGMFKPVEQRDESAEARLATQRAAAEVVPSVVEAPAIEVQPQPAPSVSASSVPAVNAAPADDSLKNSTVAMPPIDYDMEIPLDGISASETFSDESEPVQPEVSMPRSRAGNLLDRLRRNRDDEFGSPQEWLDVDDDFDAPSAGRARGSWESFRDDQYFDDEQVDGFGHGDEDPNARRRWHGGAFNRLQLGHVSTRSGDGAESGGASAEEPPVEEVDRDIAEEIEQIYHFRNPLFNSEIWFVAIGSDDESHSGAKAFLDEHAGELRGAMVIEVESLGLGDLAVASEEGCVQKVTASSRIKRLTRDASSATGITPERVSLVGTDSIASTIQKAGFQSMHLFGVEDGRPALKGSADDVLENIDEVKFDDHVNYVYELLKVPSA